jgi:transcriptional regulator with XRE-family HTH domain
MPDENVYDFGLRIRRLRTERKITRAALAKRLEVSTETIYRYENNIQTPSLERAKQIAVILHTSLDYLTGLEDAYTVKLPGLSKEQREALNDFLRVFVEIK